MYSNKAAGFCFDSKSARANKLNALEEWLWLQELLCFYQDWMAVRRCVSHSCSDCCGIDKWLMRNGVELGGKYNLLLIWFHLVSLTSQPELRLFIIYLPWFQVTCHQGHQLCPWQRLLSLERAAHTPPGVSDENIWNCLWPLREFLLLLTLCCQRVLLCTWHSLKSHRGRMDWSSDPAASQDKLDA